MYFSFIEVHQKRKPQESIAQARKRQTVYEKLAKKVIK